MASNLKWLLGAAVVGGGIVLLTRSSAAMTPTTREPTEAEDIADWRQKMGLPPEGAQPQSPAAAAVRQRIILCFGDSLTASKYWKSIKLPGNGLVSGRSISDKSEGFGGEQVPGIMKKATKLLATVKPTDVVLLGGVNDVASLLINHNTDYAVAEIKKRLLAAWTQIHAVGARVYAVKLTPWFGYEKYFGPKAKKAESYRQTTLKVNEFIDSMRGQPGGPDYVIDTSSLGDEQYRLKKEYTGGKNPGLHFNNKGSQELARLVGQAL